MKGLVRGQQQRRWKLEFVVPRQWYGKLPRGARLSTREEKEKEKEVEKEFLLV
jgi:hypothetical protein